MKRKMDVNLAWQFPKDQVCHVDGCNSKTYKVLTIWTNSKVMDFAMCEGHAAQLSKDLK